MKFYPDEKDGVQPELQHLAPEQVAMIDEALGRVGAFGEVRLKVEKGRLRFICVEQSYDALKWKAASEEVDE